MYYSRIKIDLMLNLLHREFLKSIQEETFYVSRKKYDKESYDYVLNTYISEYAFDVLHSSSIYA